MSPHPGGVRAPSRGEFWCTVPPVREGTGAALSHRLQSRRWFPAAGSPWRAKKAPGGWGLCRQPRARPVGGSRGCSHLLLPRFQGLPASHPARGRKTRGKKAAPRWEGAGQEGGDGATLPGCTSPARGRVCPGRGMTGKSEESGFGLGGVSSTTKGESGGGCTARGGVRGGAGSDRRGPGTRVRGALELGRESRGGSPLGWGGRGG